MFSLIESKAEIAHCQRMLELAIGEILTKSRRRNIGFPSDTVEDAPVRTDGTYWFHTRDHNEGTPRRLNWLGLFRDTGNLNITVEINTPYAGRIDLVSGFFVRHSETGQMFLVHSGRVGGGRKGVGKLGFLAFTDQRLIEAADARGGLRQGILVMALDGRRASVEALLRYIDSIAAYKAAVRRGETDTRAFRRKLRRYSDFYEEGRGRRQGRRKAEIDYVTRHGEIVSALNAWRKISPLPQGGRIVKDILIDLGVAVGDELVELYEAKSNADRSSVYAAIGQLLVHGSQASCRRVIVLPKGEALACDLVQALARLGITVLRFRFKTRGVEILG